MTRSMVMGQPELAAHHEAGHAIAAYICWRKIRSITIEGEGAGMVRCQGLRHEARDKFSRQEWCARVREEIYICLGGPCAEEIFSGAADPMECEIDRRMARAWLKDLDHPDASLRHFEAITRKLLYKHWGAVSQVAARLLETGSISGPEGETICRALKLPRTRSA